MNQPASIDELRARLAQLEQEKQEREALEERIQELEGGALPAATPLGERTNELPATGVTGRLVSPNPAMNSALAGAITTTKQACAKLTCRIVVDGELVDVEAISIDFADNKLSIKNGDGVM